MVYFQFCEFMLELVILLDCVKSVYLESPCPPDHYIIIDSRGVKQSCFSCANCPEGSGLSPRCGSKLTESDKGTIKCQRCSPGQTYSDEYEPSFCKRCDICSAKERVTRNCTIFQNSICSKLCDKGYYFDNLTTHECQECSSCCQDGKDIVEDECNHMPKNKQCSHLRALECTPLKTERPSTPSVSTKLLTTVPSRHTTGIAVGTTIGVLALALIIGIIICIRRQTTGTGRSNDLELYRLTSDVSSSVRVECHDCSTCLKLTNELMQLQLIVEPATTCEEGQNLEIKCRVIEENCELNMQQFEIQWNKDGAVVTGLENPHVFKKMKVDIFDFGSYTCAVKCKHHHEESSAAKCEKEFIDIKPCKGRCFRKIREDLFNQIDKQDFILRLVPWWEEVAMRFKMEQFKIDALKTYREPAKHTLDYLCTSTNTTVYELLKYAKEIGFVGLVELLSQDVSYICIDSSSSEAQDNIAELTSSNSRTASTTSRNPENSDVNNGQNRPSFNRSVSYESSI